MVRTTLPELHKGGVAVAGFISRIQRSPDGRTFGFIVYYNANRLGFSSRIEADRAAQQIIGLLATARRCEQR